jgi:putative membrane protein insertion efficiency factor
MQHRIRRLWLTNIFAARTMNSMFFPRRTIILCTIACIACAGSVSAGSPDESTPPGEPRTASAVSFSADLALRFFQTFISPIDNRRCIFSPTCSVYARDAIAKYGFIKAYPLITARLIRCNPGAYYSRLYPDSVPGKGGPCYDPVP